MTYPELVAFCGNEQQAHFLSTRLLYQWMSERQLEDQIIRLMDRVKERLAAKEARQGRANITVEYLNGERRDKRGDMVVGAM